jgi:5-methylcytosine-specific restriction endonuclease McrA
MLPLNVCPALVLNADYQPLSYYPLSIWNWQEATKAIFLDRVAVVSTYDRAIRSPGFEMKLPSVVALKQYVPQDRRPPFTRFNVFLRDRFTCQYCQKSLPASELTFDHLVPRSRGGTTAWTNILTACTRCNLRKGSRLPHECGMRPATKPVIPTAHQLRHNGRSFPPNYLHQSWRDYLYWDVELDP